MNIQYLLNSMTQLMSDRTESNQNKWIFTLDLDSNFKIKEAYSNDRLINCIALASAHNSL